MKPKKAPRQRTNQHPAPCATCTHEVRAGAGLLTREYDREAGKGVWRVVHAPARWQGSPISGSWVGGCPE